MASISSVGLSSMMLRAAPRKNNNVNLSQVLPCVGFRKLSPLDRKAYSLFMQVQNSLKSGRRTGGGGALSAQCSVAGEIFQIALIMNGLTLVGVALGFVLLRVEASIEEAE